MFYRFFFMLILLAASAGAVWAQPPPLSDREWFAIEQSFAAWLPAFEAKARAAGISAETLDAALGPARPIRAIVAADRGQPEFTMSYAEYCRKIVRPRIAPGRRMMRLHAAALNAAARRYGVPPQYIVALWGMESGFGAVQGNYNVPQALATLAAEGRRRDLFESELIAALRIIDRGDVAAAAMRGSWAGAMGQSQFMPSTFLRCAVDGDGDGRRDIWSAEHLPDVFASTANKLALDGWRADERWGREVALPKGFSHRLITARAVQTLPEWARLGVRLPGGGALPRGSGINARLVAPGSGRPNYHGGPAFLAYENFEVAKKWNDSDYFAAALGELADAIATGVQNEGI